VNVASTAAFILGKSAGTLDTEGSPEWSKHVTYDTEGDMIRGEVKVKDFVISASIWKFG